MDNEKNLFESKEIKVAMVQMILVLFLNATVLVIKNSIIDGLDFIFVDCLNPSISIFAIIFMAYYKDDKIFQYMSRLFRSKKRSILIILTTFFSSVIVYLMLKTINVVCNKPSSTFTIAFHGQTYNINFMEMIFGTIADWIAYFSITLSLIFSYIPIAMMIYNYIKDKKIFIS